MYKHTSMNDLQSRKKAKASKKKREREKKHKICLVKNSRWGDDLKSVGRPSNKTLGVNCRIFKMLTCLLLNFSNNKTSAICGWNLICFSFAFFSSQQVTC
ncbi:hypothetical protein BpHYR1_034196 [Brachionus plicatilis]|uniref:Uncharacterized protein n=1 Tax=Brachionus plicatilis TaxID=10195 RepID=A0A3M7RV44_BRAPC|nr:hypothetical protein BpHYR1_034196 [Brachionus plicatilis]